MPIRRQGDSSVCSRLALSALLLGLVACTPIEPVQSGSDGGISRGAARKRGQCETDEDCPRSSACTEAHCTDAVCSERPVLDGVPLPPSMQVVGDCRMLLCDGAGGTRPADDDTDKLPGDGNPCHNIECRGGTATVVNMPEATPCNNTGTCTSGVCSVCAGGSDCSRPGDCTVHRTTCDQGCIDTGEPRESGACQDGKVCEEGRCVPCTVGAECEVDRECHIGIIASCEGGKQCELRPISGPACDMNSAGQRRYCVDGVCTLPCREGSCMSSSDPCRTSRWDCSDSLAAPSCVEQPQPDGTACSEAASCHKGQCARNALVNGGFTRGLSGWTATGDGTLFAVAPSGGKVERPVLSTSADGKSSGGSLRGTLSQVFTVPSDALALRYVIWGGHAHVRLKDAAGMTLEDCVGLDSDVQVPVSWDLSTRRGQQLVLSIDDDLSTGDWAYVSLSGFDVIRDVDAPLRNSQFTQGWSGWETTGDATHFNLFLDYCYWSRVELGVGLPAYGRRQSVSTYGRDSDAPYGEATTGSLAQQFLVPDDAVSLRFYVHGGRSARVALFSGKDLLRSVTGVNQDDPKQIVDWSLTSERGKTLRLVVEDTATNGAYGYVGTSGFDLITSYNGP